MVDRQSIRVYRIAQFIDKRVRPVQPRGSNRKVVYCRASAKEGAHASYRLTIDESIPLDGIWTAERLLEHAPGCRLLDVGCGTGVISIHVCTFGGDAQATGIEADPERHRLACKNLAVNGLEDRCQFHNADVFHWRPNHKAFDAIVCNPPMLPGEKGFQTSTGTRDVLFVERLLLWLGERVQWDVDIYLHVFDFLGIDKSTGAWPSLHRIASDHGFAKRILARSPRHVSLQSRIRQAMPQLADQFPYAKVLIDSVPISVQEGLSMVEDDPDIPIQVFHSFVKLIRCSW